MDHPKPSSLHIKAENCGELRHKGMYTASNEGYSEQRISATAYWCLKTMTGIGPDSAPVNPDNCRPGRGCCDH